MDDFEQRRRLERLEQELSEAQSAVIQAKLRALQLKSALMRLRAKQADAEDRSKDGRIAELEQQVQIERGRRQSAERQLADMNTLRAKDAVSGLDRRFLEDVRRLAHPDKHPDSAAAHRVTVQINKMLAR